jgi:hypothetical protein
MKDNKEYEDESSEEEYEDESSEEEYEDESSEEEYEYEKSTNINILEKNNHKEDISDFFNRIEEKFRAIDNNDNRKPTEIFEEVLEELKKGKKE